MIRDTDRQTALLREVHDWVHTIAHPAEGRVAEADEIPDEIVQDMAVRGFFGWSIPADYGSPALTEPEAGSDASALVTSARRDGDDCVLNGRKCAITNAPIAGLFTVFARTDPVSTGARGVLAFLVERGMPGLSTTKPYTMMGQRDAPVDEVILQGVRVPARNLIGGVEGQGFRIAMKVLTRQRVHLAALCTEPALRMLDLAMAHAETRRQSGQAIIDFQPVAALLADCQTEFEAARALILQTARARDEGRDIAPEASICKYFAFEVCGRIAACR